MKIFYGGTFINKEKLKESEIDYPIKLEYYKQINEDDISFNKDKYGITIVTTKYIHNKAQVDTKEIKYLTNDEKEEDKILSIFKESQVTPINSEEVIKDLLINKFSI